MAVCLLALCLQVLLSGVPVQAQRLIVEDTTPPSGVFATVGVGVIDINKGTGLDIPFGVTAISPTKRILATVTFLDLGLLQGTDDNLRYQRLIDSRSGQQFCVDTTTGNLASFGRCSGDTNVLSSLSADINVLPVETVIVGNKPGSLHAGLGWRARDPNTVYGTIGMFFPSDSGRSAGVRLSMGRRFIFLGFSWGVDVRRAANIF